MILSAYKLFWLPVSFFSNFEFTKDSKAVESEDVLIKKKVPTEFVLDKTFVIQEVEDWIQHRKDKAKLI
ncbi:hypothetical protein T4D_16728 [Trichinella pseudospiralis]|uniref:Uncharacterized protein n=1 Tax=Trichinella pseudospiralis TaxID=6337 RepID=A0A0V1FZM9_TRIPS|nr:hypothetical protein T4D_16728 [Trichinella pseudospiralis]